MGIGTLKLFGIHSKVGYARHFVKLARDLLVLLEQSELLKEAKQTDIEQGDIKKALDDFKKQFKSEADIEDILATITNEELIEIMTLEKEIAGDETLLDDAINALPAASKAKLEELEQRFRRVESDVKKGTKEIRVEERNMMRDRDVFLRYWSGGDIGKETAEVRLAKAIRDLANKEFYSLKKESAAQEKFTDQMHALMKALRGKDTEQAEKIINSINVDDLSRFMRAEIEFIQRLLHDVNIIMIHVLNWFHKTSPQQIQKLLNDEFPEKDAGELEEIQDQLISHMDQTLTKIYKLARFEKKAARKLSA